MTAALSRLNAIGIAPEATPGTYVAPVNTIAPDTGWGTNPDIIALRDESYRNNDSILQGVYGGIRTGKVSFTMDAYPIETGHCLRGMIGPDTVTAAPTASTLSSGTTAGTATIGITAGAAIGLVVVVGPDGTNPAETRFLVSTTTVNQNWNYSHANGAPVTYLTKHVFKQTNAQPKTYSLTDLDNVQTGSLGYTYAREASLGINIDAAARVKISTQWETFFPSAQAAFTPAYSSPVTSPPMLGWQWVAYNASTLAVAGIAPRYQTAAYQWTRAIEMIPGSDGTQDPLELFADGVTLTAKAKAKYDVTTDFVAFRDKVQTTPFNTFIASSSGSGCALLITTTNPSFDTWVPDRSTKYATAEVDLNGIHNATDSGSTSVTLWNTSTGAY